MTTPPPGPNREWAAQQRTQQDTCTCPSTADMLRHQFEGTQGSGCTAHQPQEDSPVMGAPVPGLNQLDDALRSLFGPTTPLDAA